MTRLGVALVGAGGFGGFIAEATSALPRIAFRAVADVDPDRAASLAARLGSRSVERWHDLLEAEDVDVLVVSTPPGTHAEIARAALKAGRHVFCEKPLATAPADADELADLAETTGTVLVVDHVLRYNPILHALLRLRGSLLGDLQRFCFENDAADEDLGPDHWFWDTSRSGGILVEHGVHFFDAASMLVEQPATSVQATAAHRDGDGPVDLVSATVLHGREVLATHTHSFTHAHRCERQLMRLDYGAAEARVEGWIPVDAVIDAWTDDNGVRVAEELPGRVAEVMHVDGFLLDDRAAITTEVHRDAGTGPRARGRGVELEIPHHVRVHLTLGGPAAKSAVYAASVRAAMADLVSSVATGQPAFSGGRTAARAVAVAAAATRAAAEERPVRIAPDKTNEET